MVRISGGMDSMMLMHVLTRLQKRVPVNFELFGIHIDEGFEELNHRPLVTYTNAHNWQLKVVEKSIAKRLFRPTG